MFMPVFVCILISVRISCRFNSTDISLQMSKTDGKSRVTIPQQNSGVYISIFTEPISLSTNTFIFYFNKKSEIKRYLDNECNIEPIMKTFACVFRRKQM